MHFLLLQTEKKNDRTHTNVLIAEEKLIAESRLRVKFILGFYRRLAVKAGLRILSTPAVK